MILSPHPDVYSSGITAEEQKIVSVSAVTGRLRVFKGALAAIDFC